MPQAFPERLAKKANELYWETDGPAGQLAEGLAISRSKFYALIEPLRLDKTCGVCGGVLVFGSRTDREAGRARCSECGTIVEVEPHVAATAHATLDGPQVGAAAADTAAEIDGAPGGDDVGLWLTAAGGFVLGLLAGAWFRRR